MKKFIFIILCVLFLGGCGSSRTDSDNLENTEATSAEATTEFIPPEDRISIFVNGNPLQTSIYPEITNGSLMLPFREIFKALGVADEEIEWNEAEQKISAHHNDKSVILFINGETAVAGGEITELNVAPYIKDGYTMVPVRFVSQALGADINWDGANRIVKIKTAE